MMGERAKIPLSPYRNELSGSLAITHRRPWQDEDGFDGARIKEDMVVLSYAICLTGDWRCCEMSNTLQKMEYIWKWKLAGVEMD
ncbi:hypothetical protein CEXT_92941 [Caerostris extrusa]|uniref:Uncharacterized protein n=1 Tax=Caerostris extrusa TaxID=172846 RepID=A0AAV4MQJ0_CAEEX|nr:hypothetical protein CEXT_92941 [Caerostris extrusa]